jgi:uncharacterized membrane protein YdbT with pleckstrin-like domain
MVESALHPNYKWTLRLTALVFVIFGSFFFFFMFAFALLVVGVGYAISIPLYLILVIIFVESFARMAYNNWSYEFRSEGVRVNRGIIFKRYSSIPYERVQNVDIHRGILARIFGYSTVMIHTAGYSGWGRGRYGSNAEGTLPAVEIDAAEKIRDFLMKKITGKKREV